MPDATVTRLTAHDMHVTWLVGAATLLSQARDTWKGTLMAVFQSGEETAQGAQAMIDDGLLTRFPIPDVVLGQHATDPRSQRIQASRRGGQITVRARGPWSK